MARSTGLCLALCAIVNMACAVSPLPVEGFPATCLTDKTVTCDAAGPLNAFGDRLRGQCTWYVYGRIVELARSGCLDPSAEKLVHDAFGGKSGRHATNWPKFIGGTWHDTNEAPLPRDLRRPGMIACWQGGHYGHVGFVEEVSADRKRYRLSHFNFYATEAYDSRWYDFRSEDGRGQQDRLLGRHPSFFPLPLPSSAS
ncbi:MAG TPA: CHAP domain-containing protein [Candidatus Hydrogenedentes bacterium]|nr:CHAP domain-containing protein [Candidatus Hydrogenedentota bacterium]HPG69316.1 CHAP domain-containing protein [Candidatus Hydrogenedentota bacterium]